MDFTVHNWGIYNLVLKCPMDFDAFPLDKQVRGGRKIFDFSFRMDATLCHDFVEQI